jgi:hypothetical protein
MGLLQDDRDLCRNDQKLQSLGENEIDHIYTKYIISIAYCHIITMCNRLCHSNQFKVIREALRSFCVLSISFEMIVQLFSLVSYQIETHFMKNVESGIKHHNPNPLGSVWHKVWTVDQITIH